MPVLYDKANSIVELAERNAAPADLAERIRRAARRVACRPRDDYRRQVVERACAHLLGNEDEGPEPRLKLRPHVRTEIARLADEELPRYLFYRYRYEVYPATRQLDAYPPCLQIEPTSRCNYRCVFCYQSDKSFSRSSSGQMGHMPLGLFKRIVDQAEGQVEAVTLASRGEPLLCPDIEAMLDYMGGKFLASKINTNASLLDERKAHAILSAGISTVVFSADAATDPLYSQLRVHGKLEQVLRNVRQFARIRERDYPGARTITRVSGVRYGREQDMNEMERVWGDHVDQVAFVTDAQWCQVYDRDLSGVESPCSDLWRRTFVWFDGTVNPCDVDYRSTLAVDSLAEKDITGVWRSERYEALRAAHEAGRRASLAPCQRCVMK